MWRGLLFCLLSIGSLGLYAQTLSGTITDAENKEALEGARVMVANSTTGAITDANGKFSLTLPEGAETIIVDYFGYT
ncbi:MAG: carboxypeptidase-like regulatory domain-containing protein, partial [Bacteroidota bacterium]